MIDSKCDCRFNFSRSKNLKNKQCDNLSFASRYDYLKRFHDKSKKLENMKSTYKSVKQKKSVYDNVCG